MNSTNGSINNQNYPEPISSSQVPDIPLPSAEPLKSSVTFGNRTFNIIQAKGNLNAGALEKLADKIINFLSKEGLIKEDFSNITISTKGIRLKDEFKTHQESNTTGLMDLIKSASKIIMPEPTTKRFEESDSDNPLENSTNAFESVYSDFDSDYSDLEDLEQEETPSTSLTEEEEAPPLLSESNKLFNESLLANKKESPKTQQSSFYVPPRSPPPLPSTPPKQGIAIPTQPPPVPSRAPPLPPWPPGIKPSKAPATSDELLAQVKRGVTLGSLNSEIKTPESTQPPGTTSPEEIESAEKKVRMTNHALNEFGKSETALLNGALKLLDRLNILKETYPKDTFIQKFQSNLETGIRNINELNKKFTDALQMESLDKKIKALEGCYSPVEFKKYADSMTSLTLMHNECLALADEKKDKYVAKDKNGKEVRLNDPGDQTSQTIIFAQRLARHDNMLDRLIKESGNNISSESTRKAAMEVNEHLAFKAMFSGLDHAIKKFHIGGISTEFKDKQLIPGMQRAYESFGAYTKALNNLSDYFPRKNEKELTEIKQQLIHYTLKYRPEIVDKNRGMLPEYLEWLKAINKDDLKKDDLKLLNDSITGTERFLK